MKHHRVTGGGSTALHVVEAGTPGGPPIVFIHGWSQGHASWTRQLTAPALAQFRLVALDLRGHGDSEKPRDAYGDSALWASDIANTIAALDLAHPVLVGWSYGGFIMNDYVRMHGQTALGGLVYVGAGTDIGVETGYQFLGGGWEGVVPGAFSDSAEETAAAMRTFIRNCFARPLPHLDMLTMLGINLVVPPRVREGLFARTCANDDVLASLSVPVLVAHGDADAIVDVATGRHIASTAPGATLSVYAGAGHAPFWEDAARFNRELAAFASTPHAASV